MTHVYFWQCNGNTETDPKKPPKWCERLGYPGAKDWEVVKNRKRDRHLCPECKKHLTKLK